MEQEIELEICGNCKREIPHFNYVMHTTHCQRNIRLCKTCKEPIPRLEFEKHAENCKPKPVPQKKASPPPLPIERNSYFQQQKTVSENKAAARRESYLKRHEFLEESKGYSLTTKNKENSLDYGHSSKSQSSKTSYKNDKEDAKSRNTGAIPKKATSDSPPVNGLSNSSDPSSKMLACAFCDLELPKLDLEEHENYCGSRTDKCMECGELVMYKNKQIHMDSNHGFLKLKDKPGRNSTWDSNTTRSNSESSRSQRRDPLGSLDLSRFNLADYIPPSYGASGYNKPKVEKGESYKDISRRLDCKTEYIRNLLHDSASITIPLRHAGTGPRNHFNHNKGPAPKPPRRRNPPEELLIPCEFCDTPIPHMDLIQHETGCRPDLARIRRRSPSPEDYVLSPQPGAYEEDLPCEFCENMFPASQLLGHQATCN